VRSDSPEAKAAKKQSASGTEVRSFRGLLDHLATLTCNTVRTTSGMSREFEMLATPTPTQRRAFELLGTPVPLTLT
jgi:hypothetical protein